VATPKLPAMAAVGGAVVGAKVENPDPSEA
jgi:hypothetical protein